MTTQAEVNEHMASALEKQNDLFHAYELTIRNLTKQISDLRLLYQHLANEIREVREQVAEGVEV